MGFASRHLERDLSLPASRNILMVNALNDLTSDPDVLAIYQGGSLAKGNDDIYSDIDLHVIVPIEKRADFIREKRNRAQKWGEVLFYEDFNPASPVVVTHYASFVKVDSWYQSPEEVVLSIWLKGYAVLYDPFHIISETINESSSKVYEPSKEEVEFWRGKILAFIHETYRAVMRNELYYAISNLDRIRWLVVSGWYMEMDKHLDSPYGVWTKIEGKRSQLNPWQLSLLESWHCDRHTGEIMKTMISMVPEVLRLNKCLSKKVNMATDEENLRKIIEMAY